MSKSPSTTKQSVASSSTSDKSTKKRRRERVDNDEPVAPVDTGRARTKKKKKKSQPTVPIESDSDSPALDNAPVEAVTSPIDQQKHKNKDGNKGSKEDGISVGANVTNTGTTDNTEMAQATASSPDAADVTPTEFISALVSAAAPTLHDQSIPAEQLPPFPQYPPVPIPFPPYLPPTGFNDTQPGQPFPDLGFGANEDIMRSIKDLDMSGYANVLKGIEDAASNAGVQMPDLPALALVQAQGNQSLLPKPVAPSRSRKGTKHRRVINMDLPPGGSGTNAHHADLLATKWLSVGKLAELVEKEGLVYKKGKFSAIEAQQIKDAIERYRISRSLTEEQVRDDTIFSKDKNRDNAFWSEITSAVPQRPIISVYHYVRRAYHPAQKMGEWSTEQDHALENAIARFGPKWEQISPEVGRSASDCRDRYRNHLRDKETRNTGPWSKEEENELIHIMKDVMADHDGDDQSEIFWGKISEQMKGKRGRQQCRVKWLDSLRSRVINDGELARWSGQDAFILVHKVDSMNVRDDSEIDWKTLPDSDWNDFSAHVLQRRWLTLKRSIKGYEDMTHQEIMDILRVKWSQLPQDPTLRTKRKVVSSAVIEEDGSMINSAA